MLQIRGNLCVYICCDDISDLFGNLSNLRILEVDYDGEVFIEALAADSELGLALTVIAIGDTGLGFLHKYITERRQERNSKLWVHYITYQSVFDHAKDSMIAELRSQLAGLDICHTYPF